MKYTIGILNRYGSIAVDSHFNIAVIPFQIEVYFPDGSLWNDSFDWVVSEVAEIYFGLADIISHTRGDIGVTGTGIFVDNLDSWLWRDSDNIRLWVSAIRCKEEDGEADNAKGYSNKTDHGKGDAKNLFGAVFLVSFGAFRGGFELFPALGNSTAGLNR